ncbi:M20 metallopeptidase family protein [Gandjariella thermophila]|uniref:Hippurate hydrolase n=1 Tax=Gandjariella thermophila TaxID=1931992 RepID=A0A4D4JFI3_9PSEU|nr:M20 family metallopeptidase [Gandjariella thermophila]GDY33418.1 hippurate hydrolase [Gandjariella thermophila]
MDAAPRKPAGSGPAADTRFAGVLQAARTLQPHTVALRRQVHRRPERGLHLPATQAAVLHALQELPLRVTTGAKLSSVVAVLDGARPGPAVLLRADMDALPLVEETGLAFASTTEGTMHACGHDTHVAMLVSAARLLCNWRHTFGGQVVFMFQPGEEGHHGGLYMIDEGVLDAAGQRVGKALALHITSTLRSGVLQTRLGPIMASSDVLRVRVTGRGGHAAMPQDTVDPVPAAAAMVGALQTMIGRRVSAFDPSVISVTRIAAGTTNNVIPETAELEGTIRALSEDTRTLVHREVRRVCEHVAAAHGCTATVDIDLGYPVTVNDEAVGRQVIDLARLVLGHRYAELMASPSMGAEDFAYVLRQVPGVLAFLGACPPGTRPSEAAPNHSSRVLFDEAAMEHGVALYAAFALDALR